MGRHSRFLHLLLGACIVGVCGVAGWASAIYRVSVDLSVNARHSLSDQSRAALRAVSGPLIATAYVGPRHASRAAITDLVARFQRHAPDLALVFTDPASVPEVMRARNLRDGELVLSAGARQESLDRYTEEAFTKALLRLVNQETQWVVFVTGHGERSPTRGANFDLSHWAERLQARGYRVQEVNLAMQAAVPDNTALLVIASPQLAYLPGEQRLLEDYVAHGGHLLWLLEPDMPRAFDALARTFGIERLPATVVDPIGQALGVDNPAITVVTRYAKHAITKDLQAATLLPFAAPLIERTPPGWQALRLLETGEKAWGETGPMTGNVGFDAALDYPGPLPVALVFTRRLGSREQRVAMIGDGDFLSNTYIGNGGNQDLGTRLVDWLSTNDALLTIPSRRAPDVHLELARWQQAVIGFGFLLVLPLAFVANGVWLGWRRRRA